MTSPLILLLEDDPQLLPVLHALLESEGYRVVSASRGEQALAQAQEELFDVVIVDVRMEGMDGLEALENLHRDQPDVGAVVITGYASEADTIRALRLGAGDLLKKPFEPDRLLQAVAAVIAKRQEQRRLAEHEERLRSSWLWALHRLAEKQGLEPDSVGKKVRRLAQARGLADATADWTELAALLALLGESAPTLPQPVADILAHSGGALSRIVAVALGKGEDPELEAQIVPARSNAKAASLLSLARSLAALGQKSQAELAFKRVLEDPTITPERLEALLGLVKLDSKWCQEAMKTAEELGPSACLRAGPELGLRMKGAEGLEWIRKCGRIARTLHDPIAEAVALLAMEAVQGGTEPEQALETLTQPSATPTLSQNAGWLARLLLTRQLPGGDKLLARLQRDFPETLRALSPQKQAPVEGPTLLRIYSMGSFQVFLGDRPVVESDWRTQKVKYLLARLAAQKAPVPEEVLLEDFWAKDPVRGKKNLAWTLSILRGVLRPLGFTGDPILRKAGTLTLHPELPRWHDYDDLEVLLEARSDSPRILELARGTYLDGAYWDWAVAIRQRLEVRLGELLGENCKASLEKDPQLAIEFARRALEIDPCQQDSHMCIMQASLNLNKPEQAVRQYQTASGILKRELDMEPSVDMLRLYEMARLNLR